ncbi:MAG: hypothetical protein O2960_14695 [Verrucomicrobia bacterium]|nr:hypothetical protein [Verrucomicrobiota bacterium]
MNLEASVVSYGLCESHPLKLRLFNNKIHRLFEPNTKPAGNCWRDLLRVGSVALDRPGELNLNGFTCLGFWLAGDDLSATTRFGDYFFRARRAADH